MRPEILFPYFAPVTTLKGVGPKIAPILAQHAGTHVRDLVFFVPTGIIIRPLVALKDARVGEVQTVAVTIGGYPSSPPKGPQRINTFDDQDGLSLIYFHRIRGFELQHPVGARRYVSGKIEKYGTFLQMTHPDYISDEAHISDIPACEPVYPATLDLPSRAIRKLVQIALKALPDLPEWHDKSIINKYMWPSFHQALEAGHTPQNDLDLDPSARPRQRLAYDEALAHQLALKARKQHRQATTARVIVGQDMADRALSSLPFALTGAQIRALADVRSDLRSGYRMNRLIQGDVGAARPWSR